MPTASPEQCPRPDEPITVSLVNDYEIIVTGLRHMLEPFADRVRVVETTAGGLPDNPADVALFDTFAGRRHSLDRVAQIAADTDIGKLVLYTWDAPPAFLDDAEQHHVDGVILKTETGEALVQALESVCAGERPGLAGGKPTNDELVLSEREREVLALLALGASNREIANELYLSIDTVKTHVRHLFRKLGVTNRTKAALEAGKHGVAAPPTRLAG